MGQVGGHDRLRGHGPGSVEPEGAEAAAHSRSVADMAFVVSVWWSPPVTTATAAAGVDADAEPAAAVASDEATMVPAATPSITRRTAGKVTHWVRANSRPNPDR